MNEFISKYLCCCYPNYHHHARENHTHELRALSSNHHPSEENQKGKSIKDHPSTKSTKEKAIESRQKADTVRPRKPE